MENVLAVRQQINSSVDSAILLLICKIANHKMTMVVYNAARDFIWLLQELV